MKRINLLSMLLILAVLPYLSGCADSSTHGTEKDIKTAITFNLQGGSKVTITSPLSLESSTEQKQDTAGTSAISPTTRLQLTEGGSTAAGEASSLQDVASILRQKLHSDNTTTTTTTTATTTTNYQGNEDNVVQGEKIGNEVKPGKEEPSEDLDYKNKATYTSYGERNGGRKAWRIPPQGPDFGPKIKVVFADGHTVIVNDTSHNYREKDGFVFKPGLGPNGEGQANTGTAHHGVYLHAPYGNKSNTVTFYFNKP